MKTKHFRDFCSFRQRHLHSPKHRLSQKALKAQKENKTLPRFLQLPRETLHSPKHRLSQKALKALKENKTLPRFLQLPRETLLQTLPLKY
jgi:hypothetical protein